MKRLLLSEESYFVIGEVVADKVSVNANFHVVCVLFAALSNTGKEAATHFAAHFDEEVRVADLLNRLSSVCALKWLLSQQDKVIFSQFLQHRKLDIISPAVLAVNVFSIEEKQVHIVEISLLLL